MHQAAISREQSVCRNVVHAALMPNRVWNQKITPHPDLCQPAPQSNSLGSLANNLTIGIRPRPVAQPCITGLRFFPGLRPGPPIGQVARASPGSAALLLQAAVLL
jgi:hypothetical protein